MRVKVYGGFHSGRVLQLPDDAREGDYITLPEDLPAGEMFQPGRTYPDLHRTFLSYMLVLSTQRAPGTAYLTSAPMAPRIIRSVTVPPVPATGITINL